MDRPVSLRNFVTAFIVDCVVAGRMTIIIIIIIIIMSVISYLENSQMVAVETPSIWVMLGFLKFILIECLPSRFAVYLKFLASTRNLSKNNQMRTEALGGVADVSSIPECRPCRCSETSIIVYQSTRMCSTAVCSSVFLYFSLPFCLLSFLSLYHTFKRCCFGLSAVGSRLHL